LTRHRVGYQQRLYWIGATLDLLKLGHHAVVHVEAPRRVHQYGI
jgi:hypothetical protein